MGGGFLSLDYYLAFQGGFGGHLERFLGETSFLRIGPVYLGIPFPGSLQPTGFLKGWGAIGLWEETLYHLPAKSFPFLSKISPLTGFM